MDSARSSAGEKRRTFVTAIAAAIAVMVLAPPIVQAAAQKVNITKSITLPVKGTVKVSNNGATAPAQTPGGPGGGLGALGEAVGKRQTVDTLAAGEGFFGVGYCGAGTPDDATPGSQTVIVPANPPGEPDNVVSGILIGGADRAVTVKAPDLPSGENPVITLRTSASKPTEFIGLASGLRVSPSQLKFECPGGTAGFNGDSFVVVGH